MYRPMTQAEIDAWDEQERINAGCITPDSLIRSNTVRSKELTQWNDMDLKNQD